MKIFFYISHFLKMAVLNKTRFIITSIGMFIAVFLYSFSLMLTDSYYAGFFEENETMTDNVVIVSSSTPQKQLHKEIVSPPQTACTEVDFLLQRKSIFSVITEKKHYVNLMSYINGVSDLNSIPVITDSSSCLSVKPELCKGRMINESDISSCSKVVVINELTEQLVFQGDGIGKKLSLNAGMNGNTVYAFNQGDDSSNSPIELEVIGVIKNSFTDRKSAQLLKKKLLYSSETIDATTSIYCPISLIKELFPDEDCIHQQFYECKNRNTYDQFIMQLEMMRNRDYLLDTHINYESKETKRNNLETQLMDAKRILNMISLLLCLLSCLSVISITFFSVKERIPEIGIRKAFGATKMDVVFQFVIEMLIIAFFSSGFAIMLSLFIGRIVEVILDQKYFISFAFKPTVSNILQPFILGVTEALLCGIIPSLYAANIKVTNSLKFE